MRPTSKQLLDLFSRTSDGMIAIDAVSRIVAWNQASIDLSGFTAEEVLGRCCAAVLHWRDRNLKVVCAPECTIKVRAVEGLITETQTVVATAKEGRQIWISVSTLVLPREHHRVCRLVHFVREIGRPDDEGATAARRRSGKGTSELERLARLTAREKEVLELLTEALGKVAIAARLGVSRTTVRNHVQQILAKLEVHNRSEAIAMALRFYRFE
jgi:PAS domain S-box-containing protein